ncbi:MAG TPA: 50S ribosomal protein L15 [Candidatus Sulfotelmatobacter sp.]|nr:50S ribosomal protein L15 [Candidatus Sulfotelmatobacter sp.]
MKYNELKTSTPDKKTRVGRGISAGRGKTAGRGTKGQGARAGWSKKPGFAGGSNPLMQKLPKLPGFKSHRIKDETVYTGELNDLSTKTIDASALYEAKLVASPYSGIRLIVKGDISKKLSVKLPGASEAAIAQIEKAGGSFEKVARAKRQPSAKKSEKKK